MKSKYKPLILAALDEWGSCTASELCGHLGVPLSNRSHIRRMVDQLRVEKKVYISSWHHHLRTSGKPAPVYDLGRKADAQCGYLTKAERCRERYARNRAELYSRARKHNSEQDRARPLWIVQLRRAIEQEVRDADRFRA